MCVIRVPYVCVCVSTLPFDEPSDTDESNYNVPTKMYRVSSTDTMNGISK